MYLSINHSLPFFDIRYLFDCLVNITPVLTRYYFLYFFLEKSSLELAKLALIWRGVATIDKSNSNVICGTGPITLNFGSTADLWNQRKDQ